MEHSVTKVFEEFGDLVNVKVLVDWANRPYAFVQYNDPEDALNAIKKAQNIVLDGRRIRIEHARVVRTLFLAKFSRQATKEDMMGILSHFGEVEDINVLKNYRTGQSKGCGFVKFKYREDAIYAFQTLRQHSKWVVEWASNNETTDNFVGHHPPRKPIVDPYCIFVGNLAPNITEV